MEVSGWFGVVTLCKLFNSIMITETIPSAWRVQDMYIGCRTTVRTDAGESSKFNVEVGLHKGSALSPYLFLILMDVLTERVRKEAPVSMLFADDIVLCGDKDMDMTEYLESWRKALEERGMRVSRPKTQFMDFSFEHNAQGNQPQLKILGEEVERVTHFMYLGTSIEEEGGVETEIAKRVGAGWMKWKKCSGVLCDKIFFLAGEAEGEGL